MKKQFIVLFTALLSVSSCVTDEYDPGEVIVPSVICKSVEPVTGSTSVVLTGVFECKSENTAISEVGFYYTLGADFSNAKKVSTMAIKGNTFTYELPLPEYGKDYSIRAYVSDGLHEMLSNVVEYTTLSFDSHVDLAVTSIKADSGKHNAVIRSTVSFDTGVTLSERGVCYGTVPNPDLLSGSSSVASGNGRGEYIVELSSLQEGCDYYVRSYVKSGENVAYSDQKSFNAAIKDPQYVDLGLSVKWAACNLGANTPEEYGDYYAWGATEPWYEDGCATSVLPSWKDGKSGGYIWKNAPFNGGNVEFDGAYWNKHVSECVDAYGILLPINDAAHIKLGGEWCMPRIEDFDELISNCTMSIREINGVSGWKFLSKINGESIFLPFVGTWSNDLLLLGQEGYYWSSSINSSLSGKADIMIENQKNVVSGHWEFCRGCAVRPIYNDSGAIRVHAISLKNVSLSLAVGSSETLSVVFTPSNATNKIIHWSSNNNSIATVDEKGTVFAKKKGTARITARSDDGNKEAYCDINVLIPVTGLDLNCSSLSLKVGNTGALSASVIPSDATNKDIIWSSSNATVVSVDNGRLFAQVPGTTTITATSNDGNYKKTCKVTVQEKPIPEAIDMGLSVNWASFNIGASAPYEYGDYFTWGETTPHYYDGYAQSSKPVWRPGTNSLLTNYGAGYLYDWPDYLWATCWRYYWEPGGGYSHHGLTKYCTDDSYGYNHFSDGKCSLELDDDVACSYCGGDWRMPTEKEFDELANTSNCSWIWTVLNGVNGYKVQSKIPGYTDKWIFLPAAGFRKASDIRALNGAGYYWSSSLFKTYPEKAMIFFMNSNNISVNSDYRYCGYAVRSVQKNDNNGSVKAISLNKTTLSLNAGASEVLVATVLPSTASNKGVTWSSSNVGVAAVNASGKVTAVANGHATITVESNDGKKTATCAVSVTTAVKGVSLNKTTLSLDEGSNETLIATITPSTASNKDVAWLSSNNGVAKVNAAGNVTAIAEGSATITVKTSDGNYMANCGVKVNKKCPDGAADLGLSVFWATCNLGASKPEEYGDYYAWGATEPWYEGGYAQSTYPVWKSCKSGGYTWANCPFCTDANGKKFSKYVPSDQSVYWSGSGSPDNKTELDLEDDAAHVRLGGGWRMPTAEEFNELVSNCNTKWITLNGVYGVKFTSKKNGNSIFFPGFYHRDCTSLLYGTAYYLSSSLKTGHPDSAKCLWFWAQLNLLSCDYYYRCDGQFIRPILVK